MKKFILPVLAALFMGVFSTSCEKDRFIESVNTVWTEFTVTNDQWERDANDDLVCSMKWDVITDYVLKCGNVNAYLYEGVRQVPLPYLYPVPFSDNAGNTIYQPLEVRYDFEKGIISFIITDCGKYLTPQNTLLTMRFRAVCTYPVEYEMPRE